MSSYQQIETQLTVIEEKLRFIMKNLRMRVAIDTGLLDDKGKPHIQLIDGSIEDFYRQAQQEVR